MAISTRLDRLRLSDPAHAADELAAWIERERRSCRFGGWTVAVSGGIDSAVALALAARAEPSRVVALALPDKHSDPASLDLAQQLARLNNVELLVRPIDGALAAMDCYSLQIAAIRQMYESFDPAVHTFRVVYREDFFDLDTLPSFRLQVFDEGNAVAFDRPLAPDAYRQIVGATNLKQRTRMLFTHREAECRGFGVVGTSNRQELEQGFAVRYGDATGDILPLRHMLKCNVYDLARVLSIPDGIVSRPPTTDTYSAPQTQEEFFFGLDHDLNDVLWDAYSEGESPSRLGNDIDMPAAVLERVFAAFRRRQATAELITQPGRSWSSK